MSIESEIERISKNISKSFEELSELGVEVPVGAGSDDLPRLIKELSIPSLNSISNEEIDSVIDSNGSEIDEPESKFLNLLGLIYFYGKINGKVNADTVDNYHIVVSSSVPTVDDKSVITFVI